MRNWINLFETISPAESFVNHFSELPVGINLDMDAYDTNAVFISWIERNDFAPAGAGKTLLIAMGKMADKLGVTLSLRVAPDYDEETDTDGEPNEKLVNLYKSVGFMPVELEPGSFGGMHMERRPNR